MNSRQRLIALRMYPSSTTDLLLSQANTPQILSASNQTDLAPRNYQASQLGNQAANQPSKQPASRPSSQPVHQDIAVPPVTHRKYHHKQTRTRFPSYLLCANVTLRLASRHTSAGIHPLSSHVEECCCSLSDRPSCGRPCARPSSPFLASNKQPVLLTYVPK